MIIDVELTPRPDGHYIARALQIPDVVIEAPSRNAALEQLHAALIARRHAGIELVQIDLNSEGETAPDSWPRHAGAFPDDEAYHEMLAEVERQRRVLDRDAAA